jgi:hypothetical protein
LRTNTKKRKKKNAGQFEVKFEVAVVVIAQWGILEIMFASIPAILLG